MCFGGGGRNEGPPDKDPNNYDFTKEEQKSKEAEEKRRTIERRQDEKEETIAQESPVKTSLTYETGAKAGQRVMRGSRGRKALYTSNRGGVGFRSPLSGGSMYS